MDIIDSLGGKEAHNGLVRANMFIACGAGLVAGWYLAKYIKEAADVLPMSSPHAYQLSKFQFQLLAIPAATGAVCLGLGKLNKEVRKPLVKEILTTWLIPAIRSLALGVMAYGIWQGLRVWGRSEFWEPQVVYETPTHRMVNYDGVWLLAFFRAIKVEPYLAFNIFAGITVTSYQLTWEYD